MCQLDSPTIIQYSNHWTVDSYSYMKMTNQDQMSVVSSSGDFLLLFICISSNKHKKNVKSINVVSFELWSESTAV
jgi:hypothetical protein